jgi:hypothetical protein
MAVRLDLLLERRTAWRALRPRALRGGGARGALPRVRARGGPVRQGTRGLRRGAEPRRFVVAQQRQGRDAPRRRRPRRAASRTLRSTSRGTSLCPSSAGVRSVGQSLVALLLRISACIVVPSCRRMRRVILCCVGVRQRPCMGACGSSRMS